VKYDTLGTATPSQTYMVRPDFGKNALESQDNPRDRVAIGRLL